MHQFSRYKCSHCDQLQAVNTMPLKMESGRNVHSALGNCCKSTQHILLHVMPLKWKSLSRVIPFVIPWNPPGQDTGVGGISLLQGILPTQGLNLGLPHRRRILYQLSHKGSPRILEWVAYPFSRGSSSPKNQTRVFCIAGKFFTNWAIREALMPLKPPFNMNTEDIKKWNVATWESIPSQQGCKKKKSQILPCGYLGYQTALCFCVCLFVLFCFSFLAALCGMRDLSSLTQGLKPCRLQWKWTN